jgi:murein DD-endopeptidase MepM/ murein hydrolase activator NlpD
VWRGPGLPGQVSSPRIALPEGTSRLVVTASNPWASSVTTVTVTRPLWPVPSHYITSPFGWRIHPILGTKRLHAGMDIRAPYGTAISAAAAGTVVRSGWYGGYGNAVVIDHGGGVVTLYGHQSRVAVRAGQRVTRGQTIGYSGSTGLSNGPHLHFEVRVNGVPTDPLLFI